jgi:hypothetical protein
MAATPKKADVGEAIPGLGSLPLEKVEYKRLEDEQEKALRLHKDRLNFYIKELGTLAFAAVLVAVAVACCLFFLLSPQSSTVEKDWARSVLMSVLTGAVGFAFGKATK